MVIMNGTIKENSMKNYTGWICLDCNSTHYRRSVRGIACSDCHSDNTVYLKKGKRLSKKEEYDAFLVRMGLRTANPFGGSFDGMQGILK